MKTLLTLKAKKFLAELAGYGVIHNFPARIEDENGAHLEYASNYNPNSPYSPLWQLRDLWIAVEKLDLEEVKNDDGFWFAEQALNAPETTCIFILKATGYKGKVWEK